ncbi:hypothetical protein SAMN06298214_0114 [Bacteroidales bacterium WCE2004]|nr:hypothetical protein SAMN06298214_0114 [Bacteroidales bacterium WCE2004]
MEVEGAMEGALGQNVSWENVERNLIRKGTKEFFYG